MTDRLPITVKTIKAASGDWYVSVWQSRQGTRGRRYTLYTFRAVERIGDAFGREIKGYGRLMDAKKAIERQAA